ncbi:MAG: helix-turn-helix domain-containing protein [Acidobacteriota bacterium]|nr:helix-turn-helix domain-containing protein [Acidobacteriota bacterium]
MSTNTHALPLEPFGVLVRETRIKKNLTQQRAARGAGVSRKQWALLEQGHNASALFIQKVAAYLELGLIPLGEGLQATTESGDGVDVSALFGLADELVAFATSFAERLRAFAIEAVLPESERTQDAEAIAEFVARATRREPDGARPVTRAIRNLAADVSRESAKGRATKRKRSKREG